MHSILKIKSLSLPVCIGQSKKERLKVQDIHFHINIGFHQTPKSEITDKLENTVCYDKICDTLKTLTSQKTFALIEKLAHDALKEIRKLVPDTASVSVCVHKIHPPIKNLQGGVSYVCGDIDAFSGSSLIPS